MGRTESFGAYEIVRRLGSGGMAETFLAVRRGPSGLEQRVCLKRILPGSAADPLFEGLFLEEAKIAASLRHSNIVGIVDFGSLDGRQYMALELVDGVDLHSVLLHSPHHRLRADVVTLVVIDLLHALDYAHGRTRAGLPDGVVHRDLSPSNVLVSYAGEVMLTDFGIARAMGGGGATATGAVRGKVPYMAPEQARAEAVDGRTDLFSLGVVAYEALSGSRPFDGPTAAETLARLLGNRRRSLAEASPDTPADLARIVERLLEPAPADRYSTAAEVLEELAATSAPTATRREVGVLATRVRPKQTIRPGDLEMPPDAATVPPPARRRGSRATVLAAILLASIAAAGITAALTTSSSLDVLPLSPPAAAVPPKPAPPPPEPLLPATAVATPTGAPPVDVASPAPAVIERPRRSVLQVTVVPWGKIWIDGRPVDRSSARLELAPGRHVVGAGQARPTVTQTVQLAPGERKALVLRVR